MSANNLFERVIPTYSPLGTDAPTTGAYFNLNNAPVAVGTAPCNFYGYNIYNPNAYSIYVKMYNKDPNGAPPVVGTDVPLWYIQVPTVSSVVLIGTDIIVNFPLGMWIAATKFYIYTDSTAIATGCDIFLNLKF